MKEESRQHTTDEVRNQFLQMVWNEIDYWKKQKVSEQEKMEGVVFSILVMIDGDSATLPPFILAPCPHQGDRNFLEEEGMNWYPQNDNEQINGDIGGELHDMFHTIKNEREVKICQTTMEMDQEVGHLDQVKRKVVDNKEIVK